MYYNIIVICYILIQFLRDPFPVGPTRTSWTPWDPRQQGKGVERGHMGRGYAQGGGFWTHEAVSTLNIPILLKRSQPLIQLKSRERALMGVSCDIVPVTLGGRWPAWSTGTRRREGKRSHLSLLISP